MKYTHCGIGFLGQNSSTLLFGIDQQEIIDSIRITWPTGHIDRITGVAANQRLTVIEGSSTNGVIQVDDDINLLTNSK